MNLSVYVNRVLKKMSATHDIQQDFEIGGMVFPAYARYASTSEKYVLSRKANLWTAIEYEHVLFVHILKSESEGSVPAARIEELEHLIKDRMEPVFVRGMQGGFVAAEVNGSSPPVFVRGRGMQASESATDAKGRDIGFVRGMQTSSRKNADGGSGIRKYPEKNHMRSFLTIVVLSEVPFSEEAVRRIRRFRYDKSYLFSFRGFAQGRIVAVDLSCVQVWMSPAARQLAAFFKTALKNTEEPV